MDYHYDSVVAHLNWLNWSPANVQLQMSSSEKSENHHLPTLETVTPRSQASIQDFIHGLLHMVCIPTPQAVHVRTASHVTEWEMALGYLISMTRWSSTVVRSKRC